MQMSNEGILVILFVGLIAGWLAGKIVRGTGFGIIGDILVGMHVWETVSMENVNYILNRTDFADIEPLKFYILRTNPNGNTYETLYGHLPVSMQR